MKKFCEVCKSELNENFDFCPFCGEAISKKAKELENQKLINAELVLIANLIKTTTDKKTLELLNKIAKTLAQK